MVPDAFWDATPSEEEPLPDDYDLAEDYEMVEHPWHYNAHPSGVECITIIQEMTFNAGTAMKHLWRAGLKPTSDAITDLKKAVTYAQFEIDRLEAINKKASPQATATTE